LCFPKQFTRLKPQKNKHIQVSAQQLAALLQGTVEGDPNILVQGPAKIEEAQKGSITFLGNMKYEPFAYTTSASVLLVRNSFLPYQPISAPPIRVN